ncbi:HPF/RaiA family ribosome-associated protein [Kitasatospora sp. NPDC058965]|uniref:ribosome hibernation promotion factor n=1 Tax=Kitasatospora sp. NPDC058965 TaxID=3346682 RepID=UPI00369D0573
MNAQQTLTGTEVLVRTRGPVSAESRRYAQEKVRAVVDRLGTPALAARVKLSQEVGHAPDRQAVAQAVVDLRGHPVRAQVGAGTMQEAIDRLADRLTGRLARARHHDESWRHDGACSPLTRPGPEDDAHRPVRRELPVGQRRIVRHKAYSLPRRSPREAAFDMDALDYDFHLFTDALTGHDGVVYRDPRSGTHRYSVVGPYPLHRPVLPGGPAPSRAAVPELTVRQAVDRLEVTGLPFVFFAAPGSGRGQVVYRRVDGHYGLITPTA